MNKDRLFIGCYPTGLVYADRQVEEHGDYRRLAYLNYGTLKLDLEDNIPKELEDRIKKDHEKMLSMKGQPYQIAGNCVITLGYNS